jgi:hypothetical protein
VKTRWHNFPFSKARGRQAPAAPCAQPPACCEAATLRAYARVLTSDIKKARTRFARFFYIFKRFTLRKHKGKQRDAMRTPDEKAMKAGQKSNKTPDEKAINKPRTELLDTS